MVNDGTRSAMITLYRTSLKVGARHSVRVPGGRRAQHAQRNVSPKEALTPSQRPPHTPNEVTVESSKSPPVDIPLPLWYHRLGPVTSFFNWFHRTQGKRPYTVQLCTTLTTYLCGDLLAQDIGGEPYDPQRTLRMLTIGAIASIPGYKWYVKRCKRPEGTAVLTDGDRFLFLGSHFNYASRSLSIAAKVVIQQIVFTPIFNTYFFGMQAILTGEPFSGVLARIEAAVPVSIVNSLKLWPAVTAFSFAFIMPQYRFMFSGIFAVCWQTYLSYLNRKEEKLERESPVLASTPPVSTPV